MITKKHKKYHDLAKPSYGNYCRNEWAILGTQCSTIKTFAGNIIKALSSKYKCGYADAEHTLQNEKIHVPGCLQDGAVIEYTRHHNFQQINHAKTFNQFELRKLFSDADMVLVNGNHFEAKSQILIVDEIKKEFLKKNLAQLTNVELILLSNNAEGVFDFIKEVLPSWKQLPVYKLDDTIKVIDFFKKKMQQAKPTLNGLVLAGGKSTRMGYNKENILWHGKEQQYYMADLLAKICKEVFISCHAGNQKEINKNYKSLEDTFTGLGPYGAILSAFREKPDDAWLIVACDLPLLDMETLQYLKENRNPCTIATAFESAYNNQPEPLITIWEPKSYPVLLSFLAQGYNCPGKFLRSNDTAVLKPVNPQAFMNVNTPEEVEMMKQILQKKLSVDHAT